MREGPGLTLGYRESATTSRRKREIDLKLRAEVRKEITRYALLLGKDKRDEEKEFEKAVKLGRSADYARSISGKLLEDITQHISSALSNLAVTLIASFGTIYMGLNLDLSVLNNLITIFALVVVTFFALYMTNKQFRKYYLLRERFVRLGENPTLDYCTKLVEELRSQGVW
jgi:hypothetical protein